MLIKTSVFVAWLVGSSVLLAAPCTDEKLVGTWSLVSISADEPGVMALYEQTPHEAMRFGADRSFTYLASTKPFSVADANKRLDEALALGKAVNQPVDTFGVSEEFLFIYRSGNIFQGFTCTFVEVAESDARPGDIVLTQFPGNPSLRRVQRRL